MLIKVALWINLKMIVKNELKTKLFEDFNLNSLLFFSFGTVSVSPLTGNLPMDLKEVKNNLNKLSSEVSCLENKH